MESLWSMGRNRSQAESGGRRQRAQRFFLGLAVVRWLSPPSGLGGCLVVMHFLVGCLHRPLGSPPRIWVKYSLPPAVFPHELPGIYCIMTIGQSSITLPSPLGHDPKHFQACSVSHLEYIWSTEETRVAFVQTHSGYRGWFHPSPLPAITVHFSVLRHESDTGPRVSKTKPKASKWFH